MEVAPIFKRQLLEGYQKDPITSRLIQQIKAGKASAKHFRLTQDGILIFQQPIVQQPETQLCRIVVPDFANIRLNILHDHHDSRCAGHLGTQKTLRNITLRYYWNDMSRDIKKYVRSCISCQRNKVGYHERLGKLQPLPIPPRRWHTVTIDFAGPFIVSGEGKWDAVMIIVDKLTKRAHFIPNKTTDEAPQIAKRFFNEVIRLHGVPKVIISDRDPRFTSIFWQTLFKDFGTQIALSTAYHPQTDGQTERMVRTLKEMLRHYVSNSQHDWTEYLSSLEFAYNNSVQASTGYTPFELDIGYHPLTPHTIDNPDSHNVQAVDEFKQSLDVMAALAHDSIRKAQEQHKSLLRHQKERITLSRR
jgi:transposase InsO family protein